MNWFQRLIAYYRNNPDGYWFKRKLYGWGWMPVKWQGWLVTAIAVAIIVVGYRIGEVDDAPGVILLGLVLGISFGFGYWLLGSATIFWPPHRTQGLL